VPFTSVYAGKYRTENKLKIIDNTETKHAGHNHLTMTTKTILNDR